MRPALLRLTLAALALTAAPFLAFAQDPAPEALPDLAPREFEIRGDLQIQFPSLERQPLVGFNPPPRLLRLPPERVPYMAPYKQATVDLPPGPLPAATPPPFRSLAQRPPLRGSATLTLGNHFARTARIDLAQPVGQGELAVRARYEGLEGGVVASGLPLQSGSARDAAQTYNRLDAEATYTHELLPFVEIESGLSGAYDAFQLFGFQSLPLKLDSAPDRTFVRGGIRTRATFSGDIPAMLSARVDYASLKTDVDPLAPDNFEDDEVRATLEGEAVLPSGGLEIIADGFGSAAAGLASYRGGLSLSLASGTQVRLRIGARALGYYNNAQHRNGESLARATKAFFAPLLDLSLRLSPTLDLFARTTPDVSPNGLAHLYTATPYVIDKPIQRATVRTVDAEAGAAAFVGALRLRAFGHLTEAPSYRYFASRDGGAEFATQGRIVPNYSAARTFGIGGSVGITIPDGLMATAEVRLQTGTLTDLPDTPDIPYLSPLEAIVRASLPLVAGRALVQAEARLATSRPLGAAAGAADASTYAAANASVSYRLRPNLALLIEAANVSLGGLEYWDGYGQEGPLVTAGIRALW